MDNEKTTEKMNGFRRFIVRITQALRAMGVEV